MNSADEVQGQIYKLITEYSEQNIESFIMFAITKQSDLNCLLPIYQEYKTGIIKNKPKTLDTKKCQYVFSRGEKMNQQCTTSIKNSEVFCSKHKKTKTQNSNVEIQKFILDLSDEDSWNSASDEEKEQSDDGLEEDEE